MFTKWSQVENWIRDNGLNSWRFAYDRSGEQENANGETVQKRSNRIAVLSDAFPGDIEEKIALTRRRLMDEENQTLYGYGKRGKENTGQMYCEVRLVGELQQPSTQAVSSLPVSATFNEEELANRIRKEVMMEVENERYKAERKQFEEEKKAFEEEKSSAIGLLVHHLSPVIAAMAGRKNVAGVDADAPVHAAPIHAVEQDAELQEVEIFDQEESDTLFELMARFKAVEPQYLKLIENVVLMAERKDPTYDMAKGFLLK